MLIEASFGTSQCSGAGARHKFLDIKPFGIPVSCMLRDPCPVESLSYNYRANTCIDCQVVHVENDGCLSCKEE